MSKRRRGNSIAGQFSARLIEMLESPAYRVLSLSARRVIDRVCIELAHHGGKDNGRLPVTYKQFEEYGIDHQAVAPAIREACALGLLEVTERGRASAGEFRSPNLYRLTFVVTDAKYPPTHEWRRFPDMTAAKLIAEAARHLPVDENNKTKKAPVVRGSQKGLIRLNDPLAFETTIETAEDSGSYRNGIASVTSKNKKPGWEKTNPNGGKPHRNSNSPGWKTHPTVLRGETHPTSISPVLAHSAITDGSSSAM